MRRNSRSALLVTTALQACAVVALALPAHAQPAPGARPVGGIVTAGSAVISRTASNTAVNQSTDRAAVNWQSFNVGSQQSVTFHQPSSSAMTLNRVTGPDPSQIAGRIDANGQVVLVNQSGVTFYKGAQVNTAGLMVSAAGITDKNFMAGAMTFDQPAKPTAKVENQGTITVREAGLAALVAPQVANSGVINAELGHVVLAGAKTATLDLYGDGLLSLDVSNQVTQAPSGGSALVTNSGTILADGGTVQLTARAADGVVQRLVQSGGKVRAASVGQQAGTVALNGVGGGIVVEGQLAAPGIAPGTRGGAIEVATTGDVTVASTARITVSGRAGGGVVAIGTTLDRARDGPSVTPARTARGTVVQAGAKISANATDQGRGGSVTVLATAVTAMSAGVAAKGGQHGGNGGSVEVSGGALSITGKVDASAPHGATGRLLLDPSDLWISDVQPALATFAITAADLPTIGANQAPNATTVSWVSPALLAKQNADIELAATDNLFVASSFGTANSLNLGSHTLTLTAGTGLTIDRGFTINAGAVSLTAASGSIALGGSSGVVGGLITAPQLAALGPTDLHGPAGATITMVAAGGIALADAVLGSTTAALSMLDMSTASGGITQSGAGIIRAATLNSSLGVGGDISLAGSANAIGTLAAIAATGGISLESVGGLTIAGALSATTISVTNTGGGSAINVTGIVNATTAVALTSGAITLGDNANVQAPSIALNGAGGIALNGNAVLGNAGAVIDLGAPAGSIIEADTATIMAAVLQSSSGVAGDFNLPGTNAIANLGNIPVSGDLVLRGTTGMTIAGTVTAAGNVYLQTSNSGGITVAATGAVTAGGLAAFQADALAINAGGVIAGATVEYAPNVAGSDLKLGAGGALASLAGIAGGSVTLGAVTVPGIGEVVTADTITLVGRFDAMNLPLTLVTNGTIAGSTAPLVNVATLSGRAYSVDLSNASNTIANIGDFNAANDLTLVDGTGLTIAGVVTAPVLSVRATSISIPGVLSDGGAGIVGLVATSGAITETGTLIAGILNGSATVAADMTGAAPDANQIASIGNFNAPSITLNTGSALTVTGAVAGKALSLAAAGDLTITGAITDGGNGTTVLRSSGGTITETGTLIAGALSGSAPNGIVNLFGAGPTINRIAVLKSFDAIDFTLRDNTSLTVTGKLAASSGISLQNKNTLTVAGSGAISAPSISLTAGAIAIAGAVSDGGTGNVSLIANTGTISETGTLMAGTLSGSAAAAANLLGINQIATIAAFSAASLALASGTDLLINGPVSAAAASLVSIATDRLVITNSGTITGGLLEVAPISAGSAVSLGTAGGLLASLDNIGDMPVRIGAITLPQQQTPTRTAGSITLGGSFDATGHALELQATGAIDGSAFPLINVSTLSGAGSSVSLTNTANKVANLANFSATAGNFALNSADSLAVTGAVSGSSITIATANASALTVTGSINAPGSLLLRSGSGGIALDGLAAIGSSTATVDLTSAGGGINEAATAKISAATLRSSPFTSGTVNLLGDNAIAAVDNIAVSKGDFNLIDSVPLAVTGLLAVNNAKLLAPSIAISGNVLAAGTIDLSATKNGITETATALISANALQSSSGSAGSFALSAGTNAIANLGAIAVSGGDLTLTDNRSINVIGGIFANNITVTTPGSGQINVLSGIFAPGGTIALTGGSGGVVVGSGGSLFGASLIDLDGSSGGIRITGNGNIGSSGPGIVDLNTTGGIIEDASGMLNANILQSSRGITGDVVLPHVAVASLGDVTVTNGTFTLGDTGNLSIGGLLTAAHGVSVASLGTLTVNGTVAAPAITLAGAAIDIPGLVTDGGNGTVNLIATSGAINEAGTLNAGTLTGSATSAVDLSGASNLVAVLGDFTAASFTFSDGRDLTIAGVLNAGSDATILATNNLTVAGKLSAAAINLSATNIDIPGLITDGGAGSVTLAASGGKITETGTLIAGTLSDNAAFFEDTVSLLGATPTTNQIGSLRSFTAETNFTLNNGRDLALIGGVSGDRITIFNAGALTVTDTGSVSGAAVNVSANSIAIRGGLAGGATVDLTALSGGITASGGLSAPTLTGRAAGDVDLTGSVSVLGDFSAANLALNDQLPLIVSGNINGGAIALAAPSISVPGIVTGLTSVNLVATDGGITEAGQITTPLLTGFASGAVDLTGASPTINRIASLGNFTAADLVLNDGQDLAVSGGVAATAITLLAPTINIPGIVSGSDTVTLTASVGAINATGALIAGTLSGSAGGSASFTGPANQVAALGNFSASGITLNDNTSLSVVGAVNAGPSASIAVNGALAIPGNLSANAIALNATGAITETGALVTNALTGSSPGDTSLFGTSTGDAAATANRISQLGPFSAGSFTLYDATGLSLVSTLAAPKIVINTNANQILLASNATIATGGTARPTGRSITPPTATGSPAGAFLSAGGFTQQGDSFVTGVTGGPNILRIDVSGSGNIGFDQVAGLRGPNTWLILGIANGSAFGNVFVKSLDIVRLGGGGGADLSGSVGGVTGQSAAGAASIQPSPNPAFRLNGCPIASVNCVVIPIQAIPQGNPLNDIDISTLTNVGEETDLLLPIVSDRDY